MELAVDPQICIEQRRLEPQAVMRSGAGMKIWAEEAAGRAGARGRHHPGVGQRGDDLEQRSQGVRAVGLGHLGDGLDQRYVPTGQALGGGPPVQGEIEETTAPIGRVLLANDETLPLERGEGIRHRGSADAEALRERGGRTYLPLHFEDLQQELGLGRRKALRESRRTQHFATARRDPLERGCQLAIDVTVLGVASKPVPAMRDHAYRQRSPSSDL